MDSSYLPIIFLVIPGASSDSEYNFGWIHSASCIFYVRKLRIFAIFIFKEKETRRDFCNGYKTRTIKNNVDLVKLAV